MRKIEHAVHVIVIKYNLNVGLVGENIWGVAVDRLYRAPCGAAGPGDSGSERGSHGVLIDRVTHGHTRAPQRALASSTSHGSTMTVRGMYRTKQYELWCMLRRRSGRRPGRATGRAGAAAVAPA